MLINKGFKLVTLKPAFTLAEMLLALVITGIIAALTIPALVNQVQNNRTISSLKALYNQLNQATLLIMNENDGTVAGNFSSSTSGSGLMDIYKDKVAYQQKCAPNVGDGICWHAGVNTWKNLHGNVAPIDPADKAGMKLNNGVLLMFRTTDNECNDSGFLRNGIPVFCGSIYADVNGFSPPNVLGRDIFAFKVLKDGIVPDGALGASSSDWTISCNPANTNAYSGSGCTAKVLIENSINY